MTVPLRETPRTFAHASRPRPITPEVLIRTLVVATAIGAFLSFVGAFNSSELPFAPRTAMMVGVGWIGSLLGMASFRLACRIPALQSSLWLQALASGLMLVPPMGLVIWLVISAPRGRLIPASALPEIFLSTTVVCLAMTFLAVALNRGARLVTTAHAPAAPKFLERLPLRLRGAEVWAVEAEDHYLRLHTSKGQDLILMRLADAVAELEGVEGAQVHRSWWVAREAIADARRGDGRATLTLKDGCEVPVSRTYAGLLRERRWI